MSLHPTRRAFVLGFSFAACGLTAQTHAAAPILSIKTKFVDITIKVDDAFKANPGLFDDCAAEGKGWAAKMRGAAEKQQHDDPTLFRDDLKWSYDRAYTLRSVVGRYVSILRTDDTFEGGAHPNQVIDTILWDADAQKRISVRPFFTETADNGPAMTAMARLVKLAVAKAKMARMAQNGIGDTSKMTPEQFLKDDSDINDGVKATLIKLGPVTLAPSNERGNSSGLTFHFSPYAVGSYAEGPYTVFVPWTAFQQYLSGDGKAVFAGTRPKGDSDTW